MSQQLYSLSLDAIKYICNLINQTVDLPSTILDDLHIATNTTYSSYKLDALLKALKEENIEYCDAAIAGLNKLSKEIITDKTQITNENTIYLLLTDAAKNIYEQWLLINGTPTMIGTTEMKLDNVYTKQEADARYTLLTDFNSLKTKVDGKIDKTSILTVIDNDSTNEKVAGAKAVYDELSKRADAVNITVTTMDDFCALVDSESYSWLIPKLGFIAWNNPIAPDANNTYLVLSKQQAHAFTYIGNMYVLDYANKKWKSVSSTSNPNLLDNPWFTVNQRGATTYDASTGTNIYTVDRWRLPSGTLKVISDGVSITRGTGKPGYILQPLESVYNQELVGKTVTMSVKTTDGNIYAKTFTIKNDAYYEMVLTTGINIGYNFTAAIPHILIVNSVEGTTINIRAVKLELGSVSTLHLDAPPNYQQELAKCQRYYQRIKVNANAIVGQGCVRNVNASTKKAQYRIFIPISQPMRKTPTLGYKDLKICDFTTEGDVIIDDTLTGTERLKIKDMAIQSYTDNQIQVRVTTSNVDTGDTELARGNIGVMLADGSWTSSYIEFSADL